MVMHPDDWYGLPSHINGKFYPFEIHDPQNTQLSIARFYGGINYNGMHYYVEPVGTDGAWKLVREDVIKAYGDARKAERKATKAKQKKSQTELF